MSFLEQKYSGNVKSTGGIPSSAILLGRETDAWADFLLWPGPTAINLASLYSGGFFWPSKENSREKYQALKKLKNIFKKKLKEFGKNSQLRQLSLFFHFKNEKKSF